MDSGTEQMINPKMEGILRSSICFTPVTGSATDSFPRSGNSQNLFTHCDVRRFNHHSLSKDGSILVRLSDSFYVVAFEQRKFSCVDIIKENSNFFLSANWL